MVFNFGLPETRLTAQSGYTNETAQLMTVPPYVAACICCIGGGWLADRLQTRGVFMIGFFCTAIIGLIMLISSDSAGVKYTGCFFFACGIYPNVPQGGESTPPFLRL